MNAFPVLSSSDLDAYDLLLSPVWVFATDTLRIIAANHTAVEWLGYDAQTLCAMTIADLRPEGDRARIVEKVHAFDGAVTDAGTWTIVAKSGDLHRAAFGWRKVVFNGDEAILASIRDVSQMAKVEAHAETLNVENTALRREVGMSADNLSRLFDGLPGKMLVLTPGDYRIVGATDEYAQAVMLDRDSLLNRLLFDLFPDDPEEPEADGARNLRASLQRVEALRATDVMNLQRYPVRQPDGRFQERFWLPRNKPVLDAAGNLIYIVHRVEDVTGVLSSDARTPAIGEEFDTRELAETRTALFALRERETRLKTAEMLLNLGSWEYDFDRGALSWSDRVFDIYGVPREHGPPDFDGYVARVHPDDREQMIATYTQFFGSRAPEITFEHRVIGADGTVAHVRGVGARHRADNREIVIGFVQDITPIRRTEEQLQRQARRRRLAGRLASLGSWRVDVGATRVMWCEETAAIHDEPEGFSPTVEQGIEYYVPEHRDRIRTRFEACIGEGRPFDEVLQIVTARGRRKWVRALGEPIRDAAGQINAVEGAFQDITDLVDARDDATRISEHLRRTLESMRDAFYLLDDAWRFTFLNASAARLLQRNREDLIGRVAWDKFPEAAGNIKTQYEIAIKENRAVRFEEYYPPLDTWFEIDADPTPEGLAVYFRDVTQQRARETQLRLLEAAASNLNDILLITDAEPINAPDGPRIVYVNDAFERRTGFSRAEAIGQTPRILQGPKTQRDELDRIRRALEKWQPVRSELINYTKSGAEFWLELDIVPLADDTGWFTHWVAIERDITERKRFEETLRANEERFRLVAKAAGNAIWDLDLRGNREWWSEGLRDIFGHEPDTETAPPSLWRKHIHPDDLPLADAAFARLLSGEDTVQREQYRFRRADGTWALVEDSAFALRNDDGEVLRVLGAMTDITERRHLEERLQQSQKMEAVGQLTGGVAHDFNNLLTIMLGNAEVLEEALHDDEHLQRLAAMIVAAADRGAELTSRLLAFSRKQPLEPRVLDVAQLVQGMDGLLRRTLPENIDLEIVRAGGLWKIEVDEAQLESALLNLAVNARDAMPDGGCLTIEMANAKLDDDYVVAAPDVVPGQYVVIIVTDTGHGIPPDLIDRVFEPFFTTKALGEGTGLGLSMVFGFVKQSGGHIRVYSEPGEGTSFKLYFPRSRAQQEHVVTDRTGRRIRGGDETVLVVEDDAAVREHVTALLAGLGYRVLAASTGAEALDVLDTTPGIDLLFTDVVMPGGMGGRDLASAAQKTRPGLKILFTSGYTENAIVHNSRLDQGVALLSKPYRREQLAAKVRDVLDQPGREEAANEG